MSEGALGVLLAVGALGLLLNMRPREESVYIGATEVIKAGQFTYRREIPSPTKSPAPTPQQRSQSSGGGVGGASSQQKVDKTNREQAARNQWARVSDIPPATRRVIVNTWITRARKIAIARLAALLNARRRSGYQTVSGYTGGMGGQIAPTVPGVTGAMGANAFKALEETMGLKPAGESKLSVEAKKTRDSANGAIEDFIKCGKNQTCRNTATLKFDTLIRQNTTAVANSLYQLQGRTDPTQAQV